MSKTFALLVDEIAQELQDTSHTTWSDTAVTGELPIQLEKAIREVSDYDPYIMLEVFKIESRTGTALENKANALVDDTNAQFLSTDVGKVIYNTDDNTWADVIAFVDTGELTLSKDIMVDGDEAYEMYNENCRSNRQVYIGDVTDYIGIDHGVLQDDEHAPEYPLGTKRNVDVSGDILTILLDDDPDDSADSDADVEVFIWFKKRHRVSQLTDLAGEIDLVAGYTAGSTTIHIDGLQASGTFGEDTLITIENCRGTYRVTADATIGTNECDVNIFPGLEDAVVDNEDVTIIGSTLDKRLERLVVQLATGKAIMSKALLDARTIPKGGASQAPQEINLGNAQYSLALRELERGRKVQTKQTYRTD